MTYLMIKTEMWLMLKNSKCLMNCIKWGEDMSLLSRKCSSIRLKQISSHRDVKLQILKNLTT